MGKDWKKKLNKGYKVAKTLTRNPMVKDAVRIGASMVPGGTATLQTLSAVNKHKNALMQAKGNYKDVLAYAKDNLGDENIQQLKKIKDNVLAKSRQFDDTRERRVAAAHNQAIPDLSEDLIDFNDANGGVTETWV